jgi:hypothetical protein
MCDTVAEYHPGNEHLARRNAGQDAVTVPKSLPVPMTAKRRTTVNTDATACWRSI